MKLSRRASELTESATLAVSAKAAQLAGQGIDVVSFGAGEPDFDTPEHIKQAAWVALRGGETKYAKPASGILPLKQAVAAKFKRENGIEYDANSQVLVTVGGKEALFLAFAAILDEGDEVILPAPYWVSYPEQAALSGGRSVVVQGEVSNSYKITPDQLESAITDRTRAFVFNSPNNPGGFMYEPDEVEKLAEVLEGREIVVLSDEMYDRIVFGDREYKSYASVSQHAYEHTITFNAGSKTYSMTGWRIGYAAGPADLIKAMSNLQSQTTSGTATFVQHALAAALSGRPVGGDDDARRVRRARRTHLPSIEFDPRGGLSRAFGGLLRVPRRVAVLRQAWSFGFDRVFEPPSRRSARGRGSRRGVGHGRLRSPELRDEHGEHRPGSRQDRRLPEVNERS